MRCFWRRQWLKILFRSRCDNTTCHQQLIWWQALITIKFVFVIFSGTLLANVDFTKGLVCRDIKGIVTINIWDKKQHDHTIVLVGCLCEMHNNDGLIFLHFSVGVLLSTVKIQNQLVANTIQRKSNVCFLIWLFPRFLD